MTQCDVDDVVYETLHHCYMGENAFYSLGMFLINKTIYIESVHLLIVPSIRQTAEWYDKPTSDFFLRLHDLTNNTHTDYQDEFHFTEATG